MCILGTRLTLTLVALAVSGTVLAASLTPAQVLYSANLYNGQVVSVKGIVSRLGARTADDGTSYQVFNLCDAGACLSVHAGGKSTYTEGAEVTVKGTFWMIEMVGYHTYHNELVVTD